MIRQRYVVLLRESGGQQFWLAYDALGRIGNAEFSQAFRYESLFAAEVALKRVQRERRWPDAKIIGTTVEVD